MGRSFRPFGFGTRVFWGVALGLTKTLRFTNVLFEFRVGSFGGTYRVRALLGAFLAIGGVFGEAEDIFVSLAGRDRCILRWECMHAWI